MNESPWNKDASELFAQFLRTGAGELFLAQLSLARPALSTGTETLEQTALRAREVAGFETCYREILRMAQPPLEQDRTAANAFPDIDDDEKWEGEKPKEPNA